MPGHGRDIRPFGQQLGRSLGAFRLDIDALAVLVERRWHTTHEIRSRQSHLSNPIEWERFVNMIPITVTTKPSAERWSKGGRLMTSAQESQLRAETKLMRLTMTGQTVRLANTITATKASMETCQSTSAAIASARPEYDVTLRDLIEREGEGS